MQTNGGHEFLNLDDTDGTALVLLILAGVVIPALVFFIVRQLRQPGVAPRPEGSSHQPPENQPSPTGPREDR